MLKFLKKLSCKHDYEYLDKDIPDMMFPSLQKRESYVFKCKRCGNMLIIGNYHAIKKVTDIFMKLLNDEMSKPKCSRVSNHEFMNKVWDSYSDDTYINKVLREVINVEPIRLNSQEICNIDDNDILSLNFTVTGARIINEILTGELNGGWRFVIVKDKKGKLRQIKEVRLELDIEDEIKALKSKYLRKGIKMEYENLKEEAIVNVCNSYGILYNRNH